MPILFSPPADLKQQEPRAAFTGELPGLLGTLEHAQSLRADEWDRDSSPSFSMPGSPVAFLLRLDFLLSDKV